MSDDDEMNNNLADERAEIFRLQSEQARKEEAKQRIEKREQALADEYTQREKERDDKKKEFEKENDDRAKLAENNAHGKSDEAMTEFMRGEVEKALQERIPIMAIQDSEEEEDDLRQGGAQIGAEDEDRRPATHDTVLINYMSFTSTDGPDTFVVTYRIDKDTKIEQLHRDACAYWGCSPKEHKLCKKDGTQTKVVVQDDGDKCVREVLDASEKAQLILISSVKQAELEKHYASLEARKNREKQPLEWERTQPAQEESRLKQFKYSLFSQQERAQEEPFVQAFKGWPGVYNALKSRSPEHDRPMNKVKFRDIVLYGLLASLSGLSLSLRNAPNMYVARMSVVEPIVRGMPNETHGDTLDVKSFDQLTLYDDIWAWLRGPFAYQLFVANSTFRTYVTPVNRLRIRQLRVKERDGCLRSDTLPDYLQTNCRFIEVESGKEETRSLVPDPGEWFVTNTSDNTTGIGRMISPNPLVWYSGTKQQYRPQYGAMQLIYPVGGYSLDYDLSATNFSAVGETFLGDLPYIQYWWINRATRLISIEFTVVNYNLIAAYTSVQLVIEISPSGAIHTSYWITPFHRTRTSYDRIASALEWVRGAIILGYILLIRLFIMMERKISRRKSGFKYTASFFGLLDATIAALFVGMHYMRTKYNPPLPDTLTNYYCYSRDAYTFEHMYINEALLFLAICVRWTTFMQVFSPIFRIWKMFARSVRKFVYYMGLFGPIFLGLLFWANTIWTPVTSKFSTWTETLMTMTMALKGDLKSQELLLNREDWTIVFLCYFFFAILFVFTNGFLAIVVHSFFEVCLLEGTAAEDFIADKWLDWMLWGWVYRLLTGRKTGSSKRDSVAKKSDDEEGEEEEEGENEE